jgi:hypothetical protein
MVVIAVIAILILASGSAFALEQSSSSASSLSSTSQSPSDSIEVVAGMTSDPTTWPSGDRIWDIARAIAFAEGANVAGSNPDRLNNPGDISDGAATYGAESHSGSSVTHFPDKNTGWQWLYDKLTRISNRQSSVYSPDFTWTQIAQKWAGDWQSWVTNVTRNLGVTEDSTFGDYVNS